MSIIDTIPDLRKVISSIYDSKQEFSLLYNLTPRQLFDFSNLESFRKDQIAFAKLIDSLSEDSLKILKDEVYSIIKNPKKRSGNQFGFYHNNFGSSKTRMELTLNLLKKSVSKNHDPKICELGTNAGGWTLLWFLHHNVIDPKKYTGCDIIPDYCRLLKVFGSNILPLNLAKEDPTTILEKNNDLLIITEVVEHMPDENSGIHLLENSCNLLSPHADMIVSYPRIVKDISDDPIGHHYQPQLKKINEIVGSKFSKIEMYFDGIREYHYFVDYKS